jgi:hypothetical protein
VDEQENKRMAKTWRAGIERMRRASRKSRGDSLSHVGEADGASRR